MSAFSQIFNILKNPYNPLTSATRGNRSILKQINIQQVKEEIRHKTPDSLALSSYSAYSQNDEDDILRKIFEKIDTGNPLTFFEFGVEPVENNTLYMFLGGAKGCWYDKGLTEFKNKYGEKPGLKIYDEFITLDNIESLVTQGLTFLNVSKNNLDLLSFDLDGNDYYFIDTINKAGILPKVYCLEYNAKFVPPMDIKIKYNPQHWWKEDDYFGCSLQSYVDLLKENYTLVCCNLTGSNCFFVRNDFKHLFTLYSVADLYQPPRYYLGDKTFKGHPATLKFYMDK
jgi:hypothetical protein